MNSLALEHKASARSVEHALQDADALLLAAETYATMLSDLGVIELPDAAAARPMELRAVASLYLASTLEAAGLIQAADDFTRLVRSGAIRGDLGDAMEGVIAFWETRDDRANEAERVALFGRLFGSPVGPVDGFGGLNHAFEERLLDLCDSIVSVADGAGTARMRSAAQRVTENIASVTNDMVLMMARDIIAALSQAIAILNHPAVRATLAARTMWGAVAAIDRRLRRQTRPTLSHLRRGRAGMVVLAWLAGFVESGPRRIEPNDPVVGSALDWVDETISIIQSEEGQSSNTPQYPQYGATSPRPSSGSWRDLGR